jgi:hypothetical protein
VQSDFLAGFAQGGSDWIGVAGFDPPPGKTYLSGVVAQQLGASGQ